jgi:aminopeptidase YwaD
MHRIFLLISIFSIIIFTSCEKKPDFNPEITIEELHSHIEFLASDSLKGRKPGTPEGMVSAEYIKVAFQNMGLELIGDKGFQFLDVVTEAVATENNKMTYGDSVAELGVDFNPLAFSKNETANGEIVFAGYGFDIDLDSFKWNDFADVDVKGKWVMMFYGDPEPDNPKSKFIPYAKERTKVLSAVDRGAIGVLLVASPSMSRMDVVQDLFIDQSLSRADVPVFQITRKVANDLLNDESKTITTLAAGIDSTMTPNSFPIENTILDGTAEVETQSVSTQNVVARLEAKNPNKVDEYIVIGGHYDHLGMGGKGTSSRMPDTVAVHNGADDNASGVAALIEVAQKLKSMEDSLKRDVLFIAFGAEEMGLLGSKFFAENPLLDLEKVSVMINMDMIGRVDSNDNKFLIGGTGTSEEIQPILDKALENSKFVPTFSKEGFGPSDHTSFYDKEIPVVYFFARTHDDYHTPNDDIEFLNFDGIKGIAEIAYNVAYQVNTLDKKLTFVSTGSQGRSNSRRSLTVTLGIRPAYQPSETKGLLVEDVTEGKPAFYGGMKKNDIIVKINDMPVGNIYDYMARLRTLKKGQRITVEVMRDGESKMLIVDL